MIETKTVDFKVKGKDGLVNVHTIQRHKPTAPMCFIRTVTGHMLFCQENHPVWIQTSDGESTVVEAKDIVAGQDKIWVDNTDVNIPENQSLSKLKINEEEFNIFLKTFENIIVNRQEELILENPSFFIGDKYNNFYLNLEKLNLYKIDYQTILCACCVPFESTKYKETTPFYFGSFNLVSQLKMIADYYNIELTFEVVSLECGGDVSVVVWYVKQMQIKEEINKSIKDYVVVEQVISGIDGYHGYVYDLKTDSEEYLNNNVQTHNSFHTGGAVEFKKIDILKELGLNIDSSEETHLKRLFNQVDNDFFCNNALTKIVINKTLFQDEYAIKKEGNIYKLPLGYFVLTTGEIVLDATIEQPIELSIPTDYSETATTIELVYGQGDKILHIKSFSIAPEKIAQHLDSLVGGKSPWTTPESLLLKFHNDLAGFNFYDMTHLEVIVASVLRNKLDPMIPARLKEPYNPETYSIKALPGVISWSLGMAYENISKALSTGLISDDAKNLSQIEKVLYGEPLSDLSHELLAAKRKKR
jgi:hypothetical protein